MPEVSSREHFANLYGRAPQWLVTAPGRINLIGEHIDYLDGFVMPAAIDRSLEMAVGANGRDEIRVWSTTLGDAPPVTISLAHLKRQTGDAYWLNYIIGVVEMMRRTGVAPVGFDTVITSTLPSGAGLSSSAALETATALAVESLTGTSFETVERARLCQQAEHEYAGVPCGLMDQLAVGLGKEGHALMIDCRDSSFETIPIPEGTAIVVADTQVKHALGDGEYKNRRDSCEAALKVLNLESWRDATLDHVDSKKDALGDILHRRSRHVVTEMSRVIAMRDALASGDIAAVAAIMKAGHESLRDDFEVSCPELDCLVDAAYAFGVESGLIGARMTGGGFGGSTVNLVREDAADALRSHLETSFHSEFSRDPHCFVTRAAAGASVRKA